MPKRKPSEVMELAETARASLDVSELAHALMTQFGGTAEFARHYIAEYNAAKPGSIAKGKMLESVLRIVNLAHASHKGDGDDVDSLTDEQLDSEIGAAHAAAGLREATHAAATPPA